MGGRAWRIYLAGGLATVALYTIYRCMATQEGHTRGLEAADILKQVLDLVGLPIEGVRANLHDAPVVDPFRATR